MIKDLQLRLNADSRGKITTGMKTEKGYPKAVDYFVVDEFPEIIAEYGKQPKKLIIAFPVNDINALFDTNYVLYGGGTKIRQCDGEKCIHRIDEEVTGTKYKAGEESDCVCEKLADDDKKRCKVAMYLKAWILKKDGTLLSPNIYLFYSGSGNTASNIYSELEKVRFLNSDILQYIPFGLSVEMVSSKEEAKKKFPIWHLQAIPRYQLGTNKQFELPERVSSNNPVKSDSEPLLKAIDSLTKKSTNTDFEKIDNSLATIEELDKRQFYINAFQEKLDQLNCDYQIQTLAF